MRQQPPPFDPFSLARIGIGTWLTNLIVARKFAQAFRDQNTLIRGAMGDRPIRSGEAGCEPVRERYLPAVTVNGRRRPGSGVARARREPGLASQRRRHGC
jgi:hypothetical protein